MLSICIKGYSQSVKIADLPTLTTGATSTYVPVTKTGTTYKAEISNDTAAATNENSTIITKDAARKLARSSRLNTAANQTITAPLWDFKNIVAIGTDERAGLWMNNQITLLGDNGNGNNTSILINDMDWSKSIELWAEGGFHIWRPRGYNEGEDDPIEVTVFRDDGSIWAANGFFTVDASGNLYTNGNAGIRGQISAGNLYTAGGSLAINNPDANDGNGAHTYYNVDNISSGAATSDGDGYNYSLSGFGISGTAPYDVGTGMSWGLNSDGVNGFNTQFPRNWNVTAAYVSGSDGDAQTSYGVSGGSASGNTDDGNNQWYIGYDGIKVTNAGDITFQVDGAGAVTARGTIISASPEANDGNGEATTLCSNNVHGGGSNENGLPYQFAYGVGGAGSSFYDEDGNLSMWNSNIVYTKAIYNQSDGYFSNYYIGALGAHGEDNSLNVDDECFWKIGSNGIAVGAHEVNTFEVNVYGDVKASTLGVYDGVNRAYAKITADDGFMTLIASNNNDLLQIEDGYGLKINDRAEIMIGELSSFRNYTLPDKSGTFAMMSDISGYTGTFTTNDGLTVEVTNGIITNMYN